MTLPDRVTPHHIDVESDYSKGLGSAERREASRMKLDESSWAHHMGGGGRLVKLEDQ